MYCTCRWNGSQHAVKPYIGSESWFLPTPPAFDALVKGVPIGILPCRLVRKNYNGVATRLWKNFEDMIIHFNRIHECDRHTHRQTPHDDIGVAKSPPQSQYSFPFCHAILYINAAYAIVHWLAIHLSVLYVQCSRILSISVNLSWTVY